MAADSDGCKNLHFIHSKTVLTCEGNLDDPDFPCLLNKVICSLNVILGEIVKVCKLEPWNSVRVTLSISREAALRLRQLANEGSHLLKSLGILSVQVEGDQDISIRVIRDALGAEPQEIVLRTTQDGATTQNNGRDFEGLARLFGSGAVGAATTTNSTTAAAAAATVCAGDKNEKVQFKSPNVVCPSDSVVPKGPLIVNSTIVSKNPFPFTSMNQAAVHCRDNNPSVSGSSNNSSNSNSIPSVPPPPPYPNPPVSLSSPLLVNLLQNDGHDVPQTVKFKCPRTLLVNSNNNSSSNVSPLSALSSKQHQTTATLSTSSVHGNVASVLPSPHAVAAATASAASPSILNHNLVKQPPPLPPPPPYPTSVVAASWASSTSPTHLPDITPSLTALDDLDQLLPSIEHDLLDCPTELLSSNNNETDSSQQQLSGDGRNFLINPLTGELEPQSSEDEVDEDIRDVFTDLPSSSSPTFSDDDTSCSTSKTDTLNNMSESDSSDTRSSLTDSGTKHRFKSKQAQGRNSPSSSSASLKPTEKIKLRLKLEKSEPVNSAYKVDVSFINTQQPKRATLVTPVTSPSPLSEPSSEGLRVPPLHISLRGRNLVITNKKRSKMLSEAGNGSGNGSGAASDKIRVRKSVQDSKIKEDNNISSSTTTSTTAITNTTSSGVVENESNNCTSVPALIDSAIAAEQSRIRLNSGGEMKKSKKPKLNHESLLTNDSKSSLFLNYQMKERKGSCSDSETVKSNSTTNGIIDEKKRRLSQTDGGAMESGTEDILGSTNVGTVVGLPKQPRKLKNRELNRNKSYSKNLAEKLLAKQQQQNIALPTGEIDMEAKFKQRMLMEGHRSPHRTPPIENNEPSTVIVPPPIDENNVTPSKEEKPPLPASRSPNNGAQGEDSGIESMDALSEKSPNQASQSPHADLNESALKTKTQVPDMLDIEAQLAKMEGLNGGNEISSVAAKTKSSKPEDDPLPLRVAPPLYTYSNTQGKEETACNIIESTCNTQTTNTQQPPPNSAGVVVKNKSLLEALLIEIPEHQSNSDAALSPATRSVRTRASSKLNSPEINSPVTRQQRGTTPNKRKRHESDSSNHSTSDDVKKKTRKLTENEQKTAKRTNASVKNNDESSDSDEPLIEKMRKSNNQQPIVITASNATTTATTAQLQSAAASSVSSTTLNTTTTTAPAIGNASNNKSGKLKPSVVAKISNNAPLSTRRSVRTAITAQNTRKNNSSDIKVQVDGNSTADAVRRKTRSAVVDMELKRKKEVK